MCLYLFTDVPAETGICDRGSCVLPRILIIADARFQDLLETEFRALGFEPRSCAPGVAAIVSALENRPGIIAIDWRSDPDTAHQICISLRSERDLDSTPLLALTEPSQSDVRSDALEAGANEAVSAPFRQGESLHRIQTLKRRLHSDRPANLLAYEDIEVDQSQFKARRNGNPIPLTPLQLKLLSFFVSNPGTVFSRRQLLESVWEDTSIDEGAVTVCVVRLRRALTSRGDKDPLRNVAGVGYALDVSNGSYSAAAASSN